MCKRDHWPGATVSPEADTKRSPPAPGIIKAPLPVAAPRPEEGMEGRGQHLLFVPWTLTMLPFLCSEGGEGSAFAPGDREGQIPDAASVSQKGQGHSHSLPGTAQDATC